MIKTKVLVIGAGFYGLSLGQALTDKGIPSLVVGHPFSLWRKHMIPSMSLRSDRNASEFFTFDNRFNLYKYIEEHEDPAILQTSVPLDVFKRYMKRVESQLTCLRINDMVANLKRTRAGFIATLKSGKVIRAKKVVIATGIGMHKYLPENLRPFEKDIIHTYHINELPACKNKHILVVGSGQSAAEIIETLYQENVIRWLQRTPPIWFNEPINLPKPVFDMIIKVSNFLKFVPYALRQGIAKRFVATTITPQLRYLEQEKSVAIVQKDIDDCLIKKTENGFTVDGESFDYIISATGYKYCLEHFTWIDEFLRKKIKTKDEVPQLSGSFESSVPGIYFIGGISEKRQGPGQRFLLGSKYAVKTLVRKLKRI